MILRVGVVAVAAALANPRDRPVRPALVVLVALISGCTGGNETTRGSSRAATPVSRGANGDCIRAWNASGNTANRAAADTRRHGWSVDVSEWVVSHPTTAPSGNDLVGEGCSYFFHSPKRWTSYGGGWEADGDLRWGIPATAAGQRTPEQQIQSPNAILRARGKLGRIVADGRAVGHREWKAVIDDWYDNGELDRTHRCGAIQEAVRRLLVSGPSSSILDELRRHAEQVCRQGSRRLREEATAG